MIKNTSVELAKLQMIEGIRRRQDSQGSIVGREFLMELYGSFHPSARDRTLESIIFFFQAEDGIRDSGVTGVQTCALPIYEPTITHTATLTATRTATQQSRGRR